MTFDFFNTSNLAFGNKLTTAFKQLFNLQQQAADNIDSVLERQAIYSQFYFKNYIVGQPTVATNPCRTNEILNIVKRKDACINVTMDGNTVTVKANIYDTINNVITAVQDSFIISNDEWGVTIDKTVAGQKKLFISRNVYTTLATDNMSMITNVEFTTDKKEELAENELLVFKLKINPFGDYVIDNINPRFKIVNGDFSAYLGCNFTKNTDNDFKPFIKELEDGKFEILNDIILAVTIYPADKLDINGVTRYNLTNYEHNDYWTKNVAYIPFKKGDTGQFRYWVHRLPNAGWVDVKLTSRAVIVNYTEG